MDIKTHALASAELVGRPLRVEEGVSASAELVAVEEMAVDEHGLIHGGFTFNLADYAAMTAVNHPNVVLGGAECRFLAPVSVGERMKADASVVGEEGRLRIVEVEVHVGETKVFEGSFKCYILDRHVLDRQ